jgi:hypothetical protein
MLATVPSSTSMLMATRLRGSGMTSASIAAS